MDIEELFRECKSIESRHKWFRHYNIPARIITVIAIFVPLAMVIPTSPEDEAGEPAYEKSPYALPAGIIFLVGVGIAVALSRKANRFKVRSAQLWTLHTYKTHQYIDQYLIDKLEPTRNQAYNELSKMIESIEKESKADDKKSIGLSFFINPVERLLMTLEQRILPILDTANESNLHEVKDYLVKLINFFLEPNEVLLNELASKTITISTTELPRRRVSERVERSRPWTKYLAGGVIPVAGAIVTFYIATSMGLEVKDAFIASVGLLGALSYVVVYLIRK